MRFAARITLALVAGLLLLPQGASAHTVRNARKVDLGSTQDVKTVTVRWRARHAHRYRVQTSLDGRAFRTAARGRALRRARVRLRGREARFVRVVGHGRRPRLIRVVGRTRRPAPVRPAAPAPITPQTVAPQAAGPGWAPPWRAGVLPAPLGPSTGTVRYVAPSGSDANPGTEARPWRSISKALAAAVPGDRVLVRAGTYSGTEGVGPSCGGSVGPCAYGSPKGTASAPITVEAYPGERPVIAAMVSFPSPQWFRFSGFVVDGAQAPAGAEGVSLGNTSGAAPSHVEISYNEIRNFGRSGGAHKSQGILHFSGTDTALVGNRIHHIGSQTFYDHGIYMKAGRRVVVANNVISDITGGYGLHIWGDFDDSWVINNTVYGAAASGFIIGGNSDRGYPDRVVTANNILAGQSGSGNGEQGYAAREYQPGSGNSTRHNLGWANARSTPWALSAAGPSDNRTADPRFANAGARDLRPRGGSPAINSAESFGLLLDAARMRRTNTPDKGAFEVG